MERRFSLATIAWLAVSLPVIVLSTSTPAFAGPGGTGQSTVSDARYPSSLLGYWLPPDVDCSSIDTTDSDVLAVISARRLHKYEDVHDITSVEKIAETPETWLIRSRLSLGGDEPESSTQVFVLSGGSLVIAGDGGAAVYRKCR